MRKIAVLPLLLGCILLSSCVVSKKKYEIAEAGRWAALYSRDSLADLLGQSRDSYAALDKRCNSLLRDTTLLKGSIRNYQSLLANNQDENKKLIASLSDREKTIVELQKVINEQNQKVKNLLNSVKDALKGFSSDELTVREEGGKVYVAMSDKLLFESGKAVVNQQGQEALGKLAEVLNKQTEIEVMIEGHTDNVGGDEINQRISEQRAASVATSLKKDFGVKNNISVIGKGKTEPIASNDTKEGRAQNRRVYITARPRATYIQRDW